MFATDVGILNIDQKNGEAKVIRDSCMMPTIDVRRIYRMRWSLFGVPVPVPVIESKPV